MNKLLILLFLTFSITLNAKITVNKAHLDENNNEKNVDFYLKEDNKFGKMKHNNSLESKAENVDKMTKKEMIELINQAYEKGFKEGHQIAIKKMRAKLLKLEKQLDYLFNFQSLYLEGKLQPPKIAIVKSDIEVTKDGKVMILNQEHLQIVEPARFVEKINDWKNILW